MKADNIEDIYELSPMQLGMLLKQLYEPESTQYVVQLVFTLSGEINLRALEQAWQTLVDVQPVLRTSFYWENLKTPQQVVRRRVPVKVESHNRRHLSRAEQRAHLHALIETERRRAFNLSRPPLMRLTVVETGTNACELVLSYHHLLLDGWSLSLLLHELFAQYEVACTSEIPYARPAAPPFRDFISWLQQQHDGASAEAFWRSRLKGFHTPSALQMESHPLRESAGEADEYGRLRERLSDGEMAALEAMARSQGLTVNTLVQGAWALLLSRYSGMDDVLFGATMTTRPAGCAGAERMLGLLINTLPVRVRVRRDERLVTWLRRLQEEMSELRKYEHASLSEIHRWSEVESGQPLFDSLLVFQNRAGYEALRGIIGQTSHHLRVEAVRAVEQAAYPLTLMVTQGGELGLQIDFTGRLFENRVVGRILVHLKKILNSMTESPDQRVREVRMLPARERRRLLLEWSNAARSEPPALRVDELFTRQARRCPENVAIRFGDSQLTYRELNLRANQLAHLLRATGVGAEVKVGILLEPSTETVVSMLAVLKAGGAFVPLDTASPTERLRTMLEDAEVSVLLTRERLVSDLPFISSRVIDLDALKGKIEEQDTGDPSCPVAEENLAYVIYTSGSTGKPKGVLVSHRALAVYAVAAIDAFRLTATDRVLQFAPPGFDVIVEEIFPALLSGARIVLRPQKLSGRDLLRLVETEQLTVFELPTAFWHEWIYEVSRTSGRLPDCIRLVIVGGERSSPARFDVWRQLARPSTSLVNVYGVTEATVTSTLYEAATGDEAINLERPMPIGRPLANSEVYILDGDMEPVPAGVSGELYIGGNCLARGYQNSPALTAAKFVPHPHTDRSGARLYRTGDRARHRPDGNIEFIERIDRQIKVRGFRVELGEVEAALLRHPALKDVSVIARAGERGDMGLFAYVVKTETAVLPPVDELRAFLRGKLPEYMLPRAFTILEELPLMPNGKVDQSALPAPVRPQPKSSAADAAPQSRVEQVIAEIWRETLGLEQVGRHDNFFDLGGHSLSMFQVHSQLCDRLNRNVSLVEMFTYPTVSALAAHLQQAEQTDGVTHPAPAREAAEVKLNEGKRRLRQQLAQARQSSPLNRAT